ncbi:MAG: HEAT repeat domain-containing protein [Anaerolineae bacterium]|nr:HEAT repeat domain-containing protein [Anaerolineae bacterium]
MDNAFATILNQIAEEPQLRLSNLYILSRMDQDSLDVFREVWPTISADHRRNIIRNLVEICEVNFEVDFDPVFLLGLGDEDAEVRASAINGLWENENPALIDPFLHLLRTDETALVRSTAASALGRFIYLSEIEELEPAKIVPIREALLETIHQPAEDVEVRRRAVESIAFLNQPEVTRIIENAYYDDDVKMQVSAIFAMGRNADHCWHSRVLSELDNESDEIRFEAARACGELEMKEAVSRLIDLIDDSDTDLEVQEMAIWALGRIGGSAAQEALEICLESDVEAIALAAEEALDELNLFSDTFDMFDFGEEDFDEDDLDDLNLYLN